MWLLCERFGAPFDFFAARSAAGFPDHRVRLPAIVAAGITASPSLALSRQGRMSQFNRPERIFPNCVLR
jgi:hypothetical protein